MRDDELRAAWQIFTPLLHSIDKGDSKPLPYEYGSRGPVEADRLVASVGGFVRDEDYEWSSPYEVGGGGGGGNGGRAKL